MAHVNELFFEPSANENFLSADGEGLAKGKQWIEDNPEIVKKIGEALKRDSHPTCGKKPRIGKKKKERWFACVENSVAAAPPETGGGKSSEEEGGGTTGGGEVSFLTRYKIPLIIVGVSLLGVATYMVTKK